jgi:hypothetical protein
LVLQREFPGKFLNHENAGEKFSPLAFAGLRYGIMRAKMSTALALAAGSLMAMSRTNQPSDD